MRTYYLDKAAGKMSVKSQLNSRNLDTPYH
jgi:hypothetical protein